MVYTVSLGFYNPATCGFGWCGMVPAGPSYKSSTSLPFKKLRKNNRTAALMTVITTKKRDVLSFFFQGYLATLLGISDDYYSNMASLLSFTSRFYKNDSYAEFLEVNDTELFGVGVRIYKPVNKTKKHTGNESDKQDLLPGLIYFHGGGWTWGSLGESYFFALPHRDMKFVFKC